MVARPAPRKGDLIWMNFSPQNGHEQAGRRPALVLTPQRFNRATGTLMASPITSRAQRFPLELPVPNGLSVSGVALVHQSRMLDWNARQADIIEAAPSEFVEAVLHVLTTILNESEVTSAT